MENKKCSKPPTNWMWMSWGAPNRFALRRMAQPKPLRKPLSKTPKRTILFFYSNGLEGPLAHQVATDSGLETSNHLFGPQKSRNDGGEVRPKTESCLKIWEVSYGYESKPWYPDGTLSWFMDVYSPKTW